MRVIQDAPLRWSSATLGAMKWMRRPLVVAAIVGLVVLASVTTAVLTRGWSIQPLSLGSPGENLSPGPWSPDGTRVAFRRDLGTVIVHVPTGAIERVHPGYDAVWVDNDTFDVIYNNGGIDEIRSVDVATGSSRIFRAEPRTIDLVGGGNVDLAATSNGARLTTTVLDPRTGRVIATLPDVRAIAWARQGLLVVKAHDVEHQSLGTLPGAMMSWSRANGLRPIGDGLLDVWDVFAIAASGDALACVCRPTNGPATEPNGIYRVPLDGSASVRLAAVASRSSIEPVPSWLNDSTLVFMDGEGPHIVQEGQPPAAFPGFAATDLPAPRHAARASALAGRIVVVAQDGSGPTGTSRLIIRDLSGRLELNRSYQTWNLPYLNVDPRHAQAILMIDPQLPGAVSSSFFVVRAP